MKKLLITSLITLSLASTFVNAKSANNEVKESSRGYLYNKELCFTLEKSVLQNLSENPELAKDIISAAIKMVGPNTKQIQNILQASINANIPLNTVQSIAIASSVNKLNAKPPYKPTDDEKFNECNNLAKKVEETITDYPELAPSILAIAFAMVGTESKKLKDILLLARKTGIDPDLVTYIAISNNIDPSLASEETSATNLSNQVAERGNYRPGNSGGGNGGGGGAGGISEHKKEH